MQAKFPDRRAELGWLTAVTALGLLLRLRGLGERSLWFDEVITVNAAGAAWADFFPLVKHYFLSPPLDYLLMRPFVLLGESEALARTWSLIAGVLCIPAMHAWTRRLAGPAAALLAALLMATSTFAVDYAQEARMYSTFLLCTLLCFLALARLQSAPTWGRAAAYGVLLGAILLTHYFGIWIAALQAPWLLFGLRKTQGWSRALRLSLLAWGVGAAVFLPWLPSFVWQLGGSKGEVYWGMPFTLDSFSSLLIQFSSGRRSVWLLVAAFFYAMVQARRRRDSAVWTVAWIGLGALVLPLAVSQFKPNVAPRYLIYVLAPYYLVAAVGIADLARRLKYGVLLAALVLLVGQVSAVLRNQQQGINAFKPRWHDAARFINADGRGLPVAVDIWTSSIVMAHYLRPWENHFHPIQSRPLPPAAYRCVVLDEALLRRMEAGRWEGWVVTHFGANRAVAVDATMERLRRLVPTPRLHLPSPNESNGVDVYYVGR